MAQSLKWLVSTGSGNGLAPNEQQTSTRINDPVHWYICIGPTAISHTIFSYAFYWIKRFVLRFGGVLRMGQNI